MSIKEFKTNEELIGLFKDSIHSFDESAIIDKIENNNTHKLYVFEDKKLIYIKVPYIMDKEQKESINAFVSLSKII